MRGNRGDWKNPIFAQLALSLNLILGDTPPSAKCGRSLL
ncbi:hypothetical protein [uncultured Gammaproteobacteria bacterium]|nr:hypothetical protein [uncultured Gammaproteobacteria bacterium]CAC9579864.1 hypothetical protein [uncultured Gammaproteobacteria bacterium]CAC9585391.1 hypothetical protein [uncultured Gammaproteobacteria bacterium]CAC9642919.1 hypothetical protein [uncultured Gammaproteobacteria bacterium]CAC9644573.1 hypothetical protein [uncultured Gammaproteobacteria bacterium]